MIKIDFVEPTSEEWKKWKERCDGYTKEAIGYNTKKRQGEFKEKFVTNNIRENVYFNKESYFFGKCAYCESSKDDGKLEIDHYRPKSAGSRVKSHPGYFWLHYKYDNLLPSCHDCNLKKSTRFPVKGNHAEKPGDEEYEEPLLINPVSDNPDEYIAYDIENTGLLKYVEDKNNEETTKGKVTIEILDLNRDNLIIKRKEAFRKAVRIMRDVFDFNSNIDNEIRDIVIGRCAHAIAQRAAVRRCKKEIGKVEEYK